ncbi:gliding motility-associated C-terminal domain-containing protein [Flavobacterium sp.]|uniref:gliding motility-associated C-terminal domain-containing protein n=1 Tax=Flavobacterium sp. TaxID=239 RepID=UPI003526DE33
MKSILTLLISTIVFTSSGTAQNLLNNGDFESGGSGVGFFVHDYSLINPLTGISNPGEYARTTNPLLMNSNYISGGDHTSGTGNMLVYDGATTGGGFFWTTSDTGGAIGGFTVGNSYVFSYWIKSVSNEVTTNATRSDIGAFFVGVNNISPPILNKLAPLPEEGWQKVSYSFVATAPAILIRLRTLNAGALGNDFAVDDFVVEEGTLPLEGSYATINPTCPTTTDGSITVSVIGGSLPYGNFNLTGTVTQSNSNGIFSNLPQGTYTISLIDNSGEEFTVDNIVLSAPNDLVISEPTTICAGETTEISVVGGDGSYVWTANPADNSLTNPNSSIINVSPLVTTTYTVSSGEKSSPTNLVFNGDFTEGNVGFITDYSQVADPNPFGVQASYDIVLNPNAWFAAFASCGDHTSGDGNLMVFDGSTDPTGTIRVWCNENVINVEPNTEYTFSYYIASVAPENPAEMQVQINGVTLSETLDAPSVTCQWTLHSFLWNSGSNTTATICIFNLESASNGNDFALDDISLTETLTCVYQKDVTITVNPLVVPEFDIIGPICSGDSSVMLPTTSLNGIEGSWLPELDNTVTTTYTFTPNNTEGCIASPTLTIEVLPLVNPIFEEVDPICFGEELNPLPTTSLNGIIGSWSPELNSSVTTTYYFTPDVGQCTTEDVEVVVIVNPVPQFSVTQGCQGSVYMLTANAGSNDSSISYAWYNPLNVLIGNANSVTISSGGIYRLVVTQNGCSEEQMVEVLSTLCEIQKGISPNNDGLNDSFDLSSYNVTDLQIFNRYGVAVYTKANYRNEWFGQSNKGNELPDGTYYFVINFEDIETKTGWIYINKPY